MMPNATTVTIAPNDKFREIVLDEYQGRREYPAVAEAFQAVVEAPGTKEFTMSHEDLRSLSWDDLPVTCDTDLLRTMATYFDGVDPAEPTELIRAKLRLLDAGTYADAQIAAREELS